MKLLTQLAHCSTGPTRMNLKRGDISQLAGLCTIMYNIVQHLGQLIFVQISVGGTGGIMYKYQLYNFDLNGSRAL